jgi:electron transport complex protein RnfD
MSYKIASSPHIINQTRTAKIMRQVVLCALPGAAMQSYYFGLGVVLQVLLCSFSCVLFEALILKVRKKAVVYTLTDSTALLTGLLLGLSLPAYAPWWLSLLGSGFAMIIVKQLYGGLGNNLFNPAMMGYVFLLISFPQFMSDWPMPSSLSDHAMTWTAALRAVFLEETIWLSSNQLIDGVSMATPLDSLKTGLTQGIAIEQTQTQPIFNSLSGEGWSVINLAYGLGGLALLYIKATRWHIPIAFLSSLACSAAIGFFFFPSLSASPLFHLFSGATMLGAFFIATDPVSACTSIQGRLIFGALIGLLVYMIRTFGGYPDAVAFAVVLANLCVPLIDHLVRPTVYGHRGA